jgi:hypothetical protein
MRATDSVVFIEKILSFWGASGTASAPVFLGLVWVFMVARKAHVYKFFVRRCP